MRTKELADWLGVSDATVRLWSRGEFKPYLSPTAQGGTGRTRHFTDLDCRILAHVALLRAEATPNAELHTALRRLQTEDWADLPPMPPAPPGVGPVPMTPTSTAETAVATQRAALMREIAIAQERIQSLEQLLQDERAAHDATRAELTQQYTSALAEASELRGELRALSSQRRVWLWALAALAVVAAVLLAVVLLLALGGAG